MALFNLYTLCIIKNFHSNNRRNYLPVFPWGTNIRLLTCKIPCCYSLQATSNKILFVRVPIILKHFPLYFLNILFYFAFNVICYKWTLTWSIKVFLSAILIFISLASQNICMKTGTVTCLLNSRIPLMTRVRAQVVREVKAWVAYVLSPGWCRTDEQLTILVASGDTFRVKGMVELVHRATQEIFRTVAH